jgi:hypothetical protein
MTDKQVASAGSTMGEGITRRDFLDGVACAIVAGAAPAVG